MRKRLGALALAVMMALCAGTAQAQLRWPANMTEGQQALAAYIDRVNDALAALGAPLVNTVFECYSGFASLGVTAGGDDEVPDGIELTFAMSPTALQTLTLRVCRVDSFAPLASACIQAASPDTLALTDTIAEPRAYAERVKSAPGNSFGDVVDTSQGDQVRTYYAYAPNEFKDGNDWLTMTLVFPWSGELAGGLYVTPTPAPAVDYGNEYEGNQFKDDYVHLEVFVTATPSPDDALI